MTVWLGAFPLDRMPHGVYTAGPQSGYICMLAIRDYWPFTAKCPNEHPAVQDGFSIDAIRAHLRKDAPLALRCPKCEVHWNATPKQREALRFAIAYRP